MYFYTEVVKILTFVILSNIVVLLGKPMANWGNVELVPFNTRPVIEFLVALTLVLRFKFNFVKLGTK